VKNYGLIVDPIQPEDFLLGSDQSLGAKYGADVYLNETGDWTRYAPSTEDQSTKNGDTYACVSFGTTNAIEMIARARGFNDSLNLSDRFLAVMSGTEPGKGNSPKNVADFLKPRPLTRDWYWTVNEKDWPDVNTVEEFYYHPPTHLKQLATALGAEFEFSYQYVPNNPSSIKAALRISPVCIAVTAWVEKDGVYVRGNFSENHWTTIIKVLDNGNYLCFDSFAPFTKEVSPEACKSVAMSYYLNKNTVSDSLFKKFIKAVLALFKAPEPIPVPSPAPIPTVPPATTPSKLQAFCLAIKAHEGWCPPGGTLNGVKYPKGSPSYRRNNPGNVRPSSVGYLPIYEPVGIENNFAVFKDYATGYLYLQNMVKAKISADPSQTFYEFFDVYAPSFENDSKHYAEVVAKACGLRATDSVSKIL
jgi:hypothetical protein